eukprot:UN13411
MSDLSSDADHEMAGGETSQRKTRKNHRRKKETEEKAQSGDKPAKPYKRPISPYLEEGRYRPNEYKVPKKPKPAGAPKRPLSAYILYGKDERVAVKEQNPDLNIYEVMKVIADHWKTNVTDEDKKKYEDEANALREEWKIEKEKYEKSYQFKKYKQKLADWKDLHEDDWEEQESERL